MSTQSPGRMMVLQLPRVTSVQVSLYHAASFDFLLFAAFDVSGFSGLAEPASGQGHGGPDGFREGGWDS